MQANWKQSVLEVGKLNSNIPEVIDNYNKLGADYVKTKESGKYQRIEVTLPDIYLFKNILIVYRTLVGKELIRAFYVLFNNQDNVVYTRYLFGNPNERKGFN